MENNRKLSLIVDSIGLFLIGSFCLAYSLFHRNFAELNLNFSVLGFPIFVGEVLLFICALLFFIRALLSQEKVRKSGYLLILYLLFVLLKAIIGNSEFGPLAFRHAALFYYPLFAVFGYYFFSRNFFNEKFTLVLALFIILLFRILPPHDYYQLAYLASAVILIGTQTRKSIKYVLFPLLLFTFPFKFLISGSRMMWISNIAAILFLAVMLIRRLKVKRVFKLIFVGMVLLFIPLALFEISDHNAIISMINFNKIRALYQEYNKIVGDKDDSFLMGNFKVKLYNPEIRLKAEPEVLRKRITSEPKIKDGPKTLTTQITTEVESEAEPEVLRKRITSEPKIKDGPKTLTTPEAAIKPQINSGHLLGLKPQYRDLVIAYNNSIFRIFIWMDAYKQLVSKAPIFGFDFGKPFRSKSLEILGWAEGEWKRDGWVSMHNSYLDMIYRAGIVGIGLIIALLVILYIMIKKILSMNSFYGMLLFAVLVSWLIASNFLDILELPYTAIVFWSLIGMLYAYLFKPIRSDALK